MKIMNSFLIQIGHVVLFPSAAQRAFLSESGLRVELNKENW